MLTRSPALPAIGTPSTVRMPPLSDVRLPAGLRVVLLRHASVPMVESRLLIPLAPRDLNEAAAQEVLAMGLLHGTAQRTHTDIADELATAGWTMSASRSASWLGVAGSGPAKGLRQHMNILADVLTGAAHRDAVVRVLRDRARTQIIATRSQPGHIAAEALLDHLYGPVPQLRDMPDEAAMAALTPDSVRAAHSGAIRPDHAILILVGDVDPDKSGAEIAQALARWQPVNEDRPVPSALPQPPPRSNPTAWIRRPGAAQSHIRLARRGLDRTHPDFCALALANIVFGGYFSSRLVADLRERRGLAYRCDAGLREHLQHMVITVEADTATDATSHTLRRVEDLMRSMTLAPPTTAEIEAARRYAIGMTVLGASSQSGWATSLVLALSTGQEPSHIAQVPNELAAVTADEVVSAAARFYDPDDYRGVVLGDSPRHSETDLPL
jgi:zinc protease